MVVSRPQVTLVKEAPSRSHSPSRLYQTNSSLLFSQNITNLATGEDKRLNCGLGLDLHILANLLIKCDILARYLVLILKVLPQYFVLSISGGSVSTMG